MLNPGQEIVAAIEKPAVGGRMIARHEGQIVLVAGAIPGERVRVRIERVERRLAFAATSEVLESSPDRRPGFADPLCGGCVYSHIGYQRQLAIKGEVIADAFARIARVPLASAVDVAGSEERAYRMRARFHVHEGRAGFYREGTHQLCDASVTGQLTESCVAAVQATANALYATHLEPRSIEVSENLPGDERAVHVELLARGTVPETTLSSLLGDKSLTGATWRTREGMSGSAGTPTIVDTLPALTAGRAGAGILHRQPESFFQGNRFLISSLVCTVLDAVEGRASILDLYAGVGLFSAAIAATRHAQVIAVEGDRSSGADLQRNASQFGSAIRVILGAVEEHVSRTLVPEVILVDPPRTGVSTRAMHAIAEAGAGRIVYVSCDPATMARDARRLLDAGYALGSLRGFDLFPNTPHVEAVAVFDRNTLHGR